MFVTNQLAYSFLHIIIMQHSYSYFVCTILKTTLFHVQVVPGVLSADVDLASYPGMGQTHGLPRYVVEAGLEGLFKVPNMELDHALIIALVECWRPETHTFHLPHGEMAITLSKRYLIDIHALIQKLILLQVKTYKLVSLFSTIS